MRNLYICTFVWEQSRCIRNKNLRDCYLILSLLLSFCCVVLCCVVEENLLLRFIYMLRDEPVMNPRGKPLFVVSFQVQCRVPQVPRFHFANLHSCVVANDLKGKTLLRWSLVVQFCITYSLLVNVTTKLIV